MHANASIVEILPGETRMESNSEVENVESARVFWTVSQLNRAVAGSLQAQFGARRVRGEIASWTRAASGHWYFALKDATAQVRCVMFRSRNTLVDFSPREGDAVEVLAGVGLYEPRGEFQLTVESLRRCGAGSLWERFQRLREKLAAEGLFDGAVKRALPPLPATVGVVTSLQAAALRDVLTTLRRRAPYVRVIVYPVPVQGLDAAPRIAAMLGAVSRRGEADAVLLVRGGGSIEDLWAFNEEVVARAIRACAIPVVVGVGHESDFTIADFAADLRAATPTAAAELVAPERGALAHRIEGLLRRMTRAQAATLAVRSQRLDSALRVLSSPHGPLSGAHLRIGELVRRMRAAADTSLRRRRDAVAQRTRMLELVNVQSVLDRGFSVLHDARGALLTDPAQLHAGERVHARLARGEADLFVPAPAPAPASRPD